MLKIDKTLLNNIKEMFLNKDYEQGFLLGCSSCLEQLEHCYYVPTVCANRHFYKPDVCVANEAIKQWSKQDICFCGFIHSHVIEKYELSINDVVFAKRLFSAYNLPMMWFGIGVCVGFEVKIHFYIIMRNSKGDIDILSIPHKEI